MQRKYFIVCLVCSLWTIIQTGFHLVFVVYAYYLGTCQRSPDDINSIFFYFTYLYTNRCSTPKLAEPSPTLERSIFKFATSIPLPSSNATILKEIVMELLDKVDRFFPESANYSSRTSVFLLCFIILDGTWIVSAVSLLMGTCCGIKQSLALVFYGPWLVLTICVSIFDGVASVFFGFDLPQTSNFSNWTNFVGITHTYAFPDFDDRYGKDLLYVTMGPSLAICAVSTRFVLIWLSNWIFFFFVMRATISVYHETYKNETRSVETPRRRIDPDTSAARIRNWQLFYGAVDAQSTKSVESERDLNSNTNPQTGSVSSRSALGDSYVAYSDVAENVGEAAGYMEELRGQLPWSYIPPNVRRESAEENIELETVARKHFRIKSDSSNSGTEL